MPVIVSHSLRRYIHTAVFFRLTAEKMNDSEFNIKNDKDSHILESVTKKCLAFFP